jgi:hypothetical protein
MCATIYDDAGVECDGKVLLLFLENFIVEHSYEQIDSMVPFLMWITLPSGWTVNVPRSVQTFENILLSLLLAYAKYYPYLIGM